MDRDVFILRGREVVAKLKVLIAKGYPTVAQFLRSEGLEVIELDFSEIRKADGSLTCCSIFY